VPPYTLATSLPPSLRWKCRVDFPYNKVAFGAGDQTGRPARRSSDPLAPRGTFLGMRRRDTCLNQGKEWP
jgi:hypothetical protein